MIALEKLVCFYPTRPVFIAKLHLPIAYLYYLMVPTVKDYEQHSIRFVLRVTILATSLLLCVCIALVVMLFTDS